MASRIDIRPGDTVTLELPYSEVCMHMRVAGRRMHVRLTDGAHPMAQLLSEDGSNFSLAITTGEAGIYRDADGFYAYVEASCTCPDDCNCRKAWRTNVCGCKAH